MGYRNSKRMGYSYAVFTRRLQGMALGRRRFLGHVYHLQHIQKENWAMVIARQRFSHVLTSADRLDVLLDPGGWLGAPVSPGGTGLL